MNEQDVAENDDFFGADSSPAAVADLLELQRIWAFESDWYWATPLLEPDFFAAHAKRLNWSPEKLALAAEETAAQLASAEVDADGTSVGGHEQSRGRV